MKFLWLLILPSFAFGAKFEVSGNKTAEAEISGSATYYTTSKDPSCMRSNGPWQDPSPKKKEKKVRSTAKSLNQYKLSFDLDWGKNKRCKWELEWINIYLNAGKDHESITLLPGTDYPSAANLKTITCGRGVTPDNEFVRFECRAIENPEPTFHVYSIPRKSKISFDFVYTSRVKNPTDGEPLKTLVFADAKLKIYANGHGIIGANSPIVIEGTYPGSQLQPGRYDATRFYTEARALLFDYPEDSRIYHTIRYDMSAAEAEEFKEICSIYEEGFNMAISYNNVNVSRPSSRFTACMRAQ